MTLMTKSLYLSFLLLALGATSVYAEKADSLQPLSIRSESQTYDGNKKVTVYTGAVHMVKGTLIINADRLEVVEDSNGGKVGTLFSNPGKLVTYRQKRDGGPDLWAEGEADKVVYDDTLELIKLFNNAKLVLLDGKKRTHESSGIYISYDSRTDFMQVHNTLVGVSAPGAGYTNAVIYPTEDKPKSDKNSDSKSGNKSGAKPASNTTTDKTVTTPKPEGTVNE
jgi:lipopolysaccharide export system protein LptA